MSWWHPHIFEKKRGYLNARMTVIKEIRRFFDALGFDEVETPILQICPVMDTHIHGFKTHLKEPDLKTAHDMYLHTSPEFAMKKLMVAGVSELYQICRVFRNGDRSARHSPEFTLLEWYRSRADYTHIMDDCIALLRAVAAACDITHYKYKAHLCDPFKQWQKISVAEAFEQYAGLNLGDYLEDTDTFRNAIRGQGIRAANDDRWDDLFFRVMDKKIEPYLGIDAPTILCDYPACMASLSRRKTSDPRYAERFELYVCGVELANAFSELTDAPEQRKRFNDEMDAKEALYAERYPIDEEFIKALEFGLPESGGIALGVDRLVMLATGAETIDQVLWAPVET